VLLVRAGTRDADGVFGGIPFLSGWPGDGPGGVAEVEGGGEGHGGLGEGGMVCGYGVLARDQTEGRAVDGISTCLVNDGLRCSIHVPAEGCHLCRPRFVTTEELLELHSGSAGELTSEQRRAKYGKLGSTANRLSTRYRSEAVSHRSSHVTPLCVRHSAPRGPLLPPTQSSPTRPIDAPQLASTAAVLPAMCYAV